MKDLDEKKGKRKKGSAFDDDTEEATGVRKRLKGKGNKNRGSKNKSFKRKAQLRFVDSYNIKVKIYIFYYT